MDDDLLLPRLQPPKDPARLACLYFKLSCRARKSAARKTASHSCFLNQYNAPVSGCFSASTYRVMGCGTSTSVVVPSLPDVSHQPAANTAAAKPAAAKPAAELTADATSVAASKPASEVGWVAAVSNKAVKPAAELTTETTSVAPVPAPAPVSTSAGVEWVAAVSKKAAALQRGADAKIAIWEIALENKNVMESAPPVHAVLGTAGTLEMAPLPSCEQQYAGGNSSAHEKFTTWVDGTATKGDSVRVDELAVWGDTTVVAIQVTCTVRKNGGEAKVVVSPAPSPSLVGSAVPRRVVLKSGEYIKTVTIWSSDEHGAFKQKNKDNNLEYVSYGAIGSISITLSSCRVFRFGASWAGCQHSVCAPSFDKTIPDGAHIIGFSGERSADGRLSRLGVVYVPLLQSDVCKAPPRPYKAEYNAVSLSYLRRFYNAFVKERDDAAKAACRKGSVPKLTTTDEVAKEIIMAVTWDMETGRALRFADTMELDDLWGGPGSGRDGFFVSHAFGNPFKLILDSLETHFTAAGATFDTTFVWLDILAINQASHPLRALVFHKSLSLKSVSLSLRACRSPPSTNSSSNSHNTCSRSVDRRTPEWTWMPGGRCRRRSTRPQLRWWCWINRRRCRSLGYGACTRSASRHRTSLRSWHMASARTIQPM